MDRLNLDISKYTCKELEEIFGIQMGANSNDITEQIQNIKNNLTDNEKLNLNSKNDIDNFLTKVVDKLTKEIKNKENQKSLNEKIEAARNNTELLSIDNMEHPIIKSNQSLGLLPVNEQNSVDKENRISIIKINIDSAFRDNYYNSTSSNFILTIPQEYTNVISMSITSLVIPLTIYNINEKLANNFFHYSFNDVPNSCYFLNLSSGFYYGNSEVKNGMQKWIENEVEDQLKHNIKFKIDQKTGKSTFTHVSRPFTIRFDLSQPAVSNSQPTTEYETDDTPLPLKLGWMLGFRTKKNVSSNPSDNGNVVESDAPAMLFNPKYLYFSVNEFTNLKTDNFTGMFSNSITSRDILTRINYQTWLHENYVNNFSYNVIEDGSNSVRKYFGPVNIQKLEFKILDEFGRVVDFNNMDWSAVIQLEVQT